MLFMGVIHVGANEPAHRGTSKEISGIMLLRGETRFAHSLHPTKAASGRFATLSFLWLFPCAFVLGLGRDPVAI